MRLMASLSSRVMVATVTLTLVIILVFIFLFERHTEQAVFEAQEQNARNLVETILQHVHNGYASIVYHEKAILDDRKQKLTDVAGIARTIVQSYYDKSQKGLITEDEAKKAAIDELRHIRYANNIGYVWVNDNSRPFPRMIMHPTLPNLDGKILDDPEFDCALGVGKNLFVAFADICDEKGGGYVDYLWPKPTPEGLTAKQPKLSFVTLFKEWKWIIGTGLYIDDIQKERQERFDAVLEDLRKTYGKIRIGRSGYAYIFDGKRKLLVHPVMESWDLERLINPDTGAYLFDDLMKASRTPDRAYEYTWSKPSDPENFIWKKRAHIIYFEPLDWYVGSSYYLDEIKEPLREIKRESILLMFVLVLIAVVFSYLLSKSISRPLQKLAHAATSIRHEGIHAAKIPIAGPTETRELGGVFSQMMEEIRKSEASLRDSRENLRITLDSIGDAVIATDTNQHIVRMNPVAEMLTGWNADDAMGKLLDQVFVIVDVNTGNRVASPIGRVLENGQVIRMTEHSVLVAKDGTERPIADSGAPIRDREGNIVGSVLVFRDVTEEYALQADRERLNAILEVTSDLVAVVTPEEEVLYMNRAGRELIGWSQDDVRPRYAREFHSGWSYRLIEEEGIPEAIEKGRWAGETSVIGPDGSEIPVSQVIMAHKSPSGKVRYLSTIIRDISDRINAEEERRRLEEQLLQSQKMEAIGQLSGGVAHDFNNILTGIMGNAQLLAMKMEKESNESRIMESIVDACMRAGDLTKQLLTFARKAKIKAESVDVNRLISEGVVGLLARSIDRRIEIVQQLDASPSTVQGDASQLQNAILNLGVNARDAMPDGGSLIFSTRNIELDDAFCREHAYEVDPGEYLEISVKDTGIGMDEELQKRIFEPFFTTKKPGEGTGLGLASVFGCVKSHHGLIRVYSQVGCGTTFRILLPVSEPLTAEVQMVKEEELVKGQGHVLVVDDEDIVRTFACKALKQLGYDVSSCNDGQEAVEFYREHADKIDLVILDLVMPRLGGQDAFRQLKDINPSVRVLVASGFAQNTAVSALLEDGALAFISKPFRIGQLAEEVAKYVHA